MTPDSDRQLPNKTSDRPSPCGSPRRKRLQCVIFAIFILSRLSVWFFEAQKAAAKQKAWRWQLQTKTETACAIPGAQGCSEAGKEAEGHRAFNPFVNDRMQVQTGAAARGGSKETSCQEGRATSIYFFLQRLNFWSRGRMTVLSTQNGCIQHKAILHLANHLQRKEPRKHTLRVNANLCKHRPTQYMHIMFHHRQKRTRFLCKVVGVTNPRSQ